MIARAQTEPAESVLLHAAPDAVTVEVFDECGNRLAYGLEFSRTQDSPMCRLRREGGSISREDIWPSAADAGVTVLLPGGEASVLQDLVERRGPDGVAVGGGIL